jgi:putative ABC transport system permease protein
VGYVIMRRWLESFAYRTDVRPALILAAGAGVLALALLSVAAQTLRAAWTDPASTLRTE